MMKRESKIFVAGHKGLVGSAIVRKLTNEGYTSLVLRDKKELDLLNQGAVNSFFTKEKIEFVILAAAKVGGIHANNTFPADFLYENLQIATNVIHSSAEHNVQKLLFLGSSCIYPRLAPQPIHEESLLTSPLEETNEGYAIAKIAGLKLCEMYQRQYKKCFISAMPTNLYGPNDNFHPNNSHVIPGIMRRFHQAKTENKEAVEMWGSGKPLREFLHVDDLAAAVLLLMQKYTSPLTINVGTGKDCTIAELGEIMARVVGFKGKITFDPSKPDGTPRKCLDISKISSLGWKPSRSLEQGLKDTYNWALQNQVFAKSELS